MTAALPRRSILSLLGLAPAAAAVGASPASVMGAVRLSPGRIGTLGDLARGTGEDRSVETIGFDIVRGASFSLGDLDLAQDATLSATSARIEAARATTFPPEIAAYRSFAPHLKRRLLRELLEREAARLRESGLGTPPTPGTGA